MKRNWGAVTLAVGGLVCGWPAAQAGPLSAVFGDVKMELGNLDMGSTGYGSTPGQVCTTVAGCDAALSPGSAAPGAVGSEDTWGIFSISRIVRGSTTLWTQGEGGDWLTAMFYGLADHDVTVMPDPFDSSRHLTRNYAVGGRMDIYRGSSDVYAAAGALGLAGRTATDAFTGITSGGTQTLWLSLLFDLGVDNTAVGSRSSYQTVYSNTNFAGQGQGYLSVAGGEAASRFDSDTVANGVGGLSDFKLSNTYQADASAPTWTVVSTADLIGHTVPEPGSLALVGASLLSLGAVSRRRQTAASSCGDGRIPRPPRED